jgi:hypothetical protein
MAHAHNSTTSLMTHSDFTGVFFFLTQYIYILKIEPRKSTVTVIGLLNINEAV